MALTVQEMAAQLQRAGYPGPYDPASVQAAYLRTATPADLAASGLVAPAPRAAAPGTVSATSAPQQGFNTAAAQQAVALANNAAQIAYNNAKLQQVDIPGQRLQQDQLAFDKAKEAWSEAFQQAQANIKNPLDIAGITGVYNGQPTLAAQGQQSDVALRYLTLLSGLRGPNDPLQYLRTLAGTPAGLTDIVNSAAGRYQLGTAPSGEQSAQASIAGQLGNLAMVQGAGGAGGAGGGLAGVGGAAAAAGGGAAPANMAQAAAATAPTGGTENGTFAKSPWGVNTSVNQPGTNPSTWDQRGYQGVFGLNSMRQATQELGGSPGTPPAQVLQGERGLAVTGYDPTTGNLHFNYNFLQNKPAGSFFMLQDITGQENSPKALYAKGIAGYDFSGQSGAGTLQVAPSQMDPTHTYEIVSVVPGEGGSTSHIRFQPGMLSGLPNPNAPAPAAPAPVAPPALVPQPAPAVTGTDPISQVQNVLSGLPLPNQITAQNFNQMDPSQRGALWGAYEFGGPTGAMRPEDAQFAFQSSLPRYSGPTSGTVNLKV